MERGPMCCTFAEYKVGSTCDATDAILALSHGHVVVVLPQLKANLLLAHSLL